MITWTDSEIGDDRRFKTFSKSISNCQIGEMMSCGNVTRISVTRSLEAACKKVGESLVKSVHWGRTHRSIAIRELSSCWFETAANGLMNQRYFLAQRNFRKNSLQNPCSVLSMTADYFDSFMICTIMRRLLQSNRIFPRFEAARPEAGDIWGCEASQAVQKL